MPLHLNQINTAFDPKALAAQTGPPVGYWVLDLEIRESIPLKISNVARAGVEPATFRVSVERSYQLSYLATQNRPTSEMKTDLAATPTGLEPATSAVTGRRANQLRYGA